MKKNMKKTTITLGLAVATFFSFNQYAEAKSFKDVSESTNYYYNEIEEFSKQGIIKGYDDGTFRPNAKMSRSHASKVLIEFLKKTDEYDNLETTSSPLKFKDVNESDWYYDYIKIMKENGIISGHQDNTFKPNDDVTKAQLVKMIVEEFDIPKMDSKKNVFEDMKSGQWYNIYINSAYDAGIITKDYTKNFNPNSSATREELVVFTSRAIKWYETKGKSPEETIFNRIDETANRVTKAPNSYNMMLEGLKNNDEWIYYDMNELKTSEEVGEFITKEFYRGVSSRFFIKNWTTYYTTGKVKVQYLKSPQESKKMIEQADKKVEEILSKIIKPTYNDFDKVKAIHDYLVLNVEYDLDVYNEVNNDPMSYTIYGTVFNGIATCDGYSRTINSMLNKLGIENYYVTGYVDNGGYHAWNLVKIDNEYYYLDATWNDPIGMGEDYIKYEYFLLDKNTMAKDRTWETPNLPEANSKKYLNK